MIARAVGKYQRMSARKSRLVADKVRGLNAVQALDMLRYTRSSGAVVVSKVLKSALSNAENNHEFFDRDKLYISKITIDEGPAWKRFMPRAYGRASAIRKPTCHVTIELSEVEAKQ